MTGPTRPAELTSHRLARWRSVRPAGRRTVLPAVLLWALLAVLATVLSPEGGCTPAVPCGPDWAGAVEVVLALGSPVALLWWPRLGVPLSLAAAGVFCWVETRLGDLPGWLSVGLPLVLVAATVDAARRLRAAAARAAALAAGSPRLAVPGPPLLPRWTGGTVLGALLLAAAPVPVVYGVLHGRSVAAAESRARHVVGTVVAHGGDGYLVTVAFEDRREQLDTATADDYPVGSEQELLLREDGVVELAAERYDPAGWLAGGLALALLGLLLGGRSRQHLHAVRRLLSEPQPAHAVRVAWAPKGAQVLAVDGSVDRSLLSLRMAPAEAPAEVPDDLDDQELPEVEPATLYGVPVPGQACAVVLASGLRLLPLRPARRGDDAWRSQLVDVDVDADRPEELDLDAADLPPAGHEDWRARYARPERWRVPLGLALVTGALVGGYLVARSSEGVLTTLWRCGIAASFAFNGLVHLTSRVRLTPEALVHEGPTTRRTIPWSALAGVTVAEGDVVLARLHDGELLPLTWLTHRPHWAGRQRRRAWAQRWAQLLVAEARRAAGSPQGQLTTEPRLPGAAVATAFTAAVLVGLWTRGSL